MSGFGEQTIGNVWSCAKLDFIEWAQITARRIPTSGKCRQYLLQVSRQSALFLFFEWDCVKHALAVVANAQLRFGDELSM